MRAANNTPLLSHRRKQIKRLGTNHYPLMYTSSPTSRQLSDMVRKGEFRQDLYCRLAVLTVEASPLRERRDDIPVMVNQFLNEAAKAGTGPTGEYAIDEDAVELLCRCD
jgi:DNA-binding NtrC family response regulator